MAGLSDLACHGFYDFYQGYAPHWRRCPPRLCADKRPRCFTRPQRHGPLGYGLLEGARGVTDIDVSGDLRFNRSVLTGEVRHDSGDSIRKEGTHVRKSASIGSHLKARRRTSVSVIGNHHL